MKNRFIGIMAAAMMFSATAPIPAALADEAAQTEHGHDHGAQMQSVNTVPGEGKKYTCPMDPEIVSDKPGACPKCGMFLEEVKAPAANDKKKVPSPQ
ncbi:MAG: hypothetical protein HZB29_12435 [Nitrospinae bacterium]|nr:hypothetical protein [Nitrospinota bacterium]